MALNIPLPKVLYDVEAGGPVTTSARGMNALRNARLENEIKQSEAEYAPWTNYANAASKLAYSQFVGPQAIASILADPKIRGLLSEEQYKNLSNAVTSQLNNPVNALSGMPTPQGGGNNSLLGKLFNKLGIGQTQQSQPQNAMQQLPGTGEATQEQVNYLADNGQQAFNQRYGIPPLQPGESYVYPGTSAAPKPSGPLSATSPSYSRAATNLPGGAVGAANPTAITAAGEAGLKTQSEAEAKAITKQWQDRQDDVRDQVSGAQEMERQLDRLVEARARLNPLLETGPLAGRVPGFSSAAQESDTAESNLVAARLKAWQTSRITNMDIGFGKTLKPGRYMNEDAFNNEVNYEKGLSQRLQEYPAFAQISQKLGLTPAESDAIWARYANEKPYFDPKSHKILSNNLGTWEQYLTPGSIQETFSPSFKKQMDQYRKNMAGGDPKEDKKILNETSKQQLPENKLQNKNEIVQMEGIDPIDKQIKKWNVPKNKVQVYEKNGFKRIS
ncbi:MAG: hypothetical protein Q8936_14290 [Bacillota bacterium]|nr:hypothetical protein [Bacillota bacterium]